jgi:hypothetical protein
VGRCLTNAGICPTLNVRRCTSSLVFQETIHLYRSVRNRTHLASGCGWESRSRCAGCEGLVWATGDTSARSLLTRRQQAPARCLALATAGEPVKALADEGVAFTTGGLQTRAVEHLDLPPMVGNQPGIL